MYQRFLIEGLCVHSARTQRTYAMILALAHKGLDIVPVLTYRGGVD